jgi:purine-nucleoside phosphorylase
MTPLEELLRTCRERAPLAGVVLGSGLNQVADSWPTVHDIGFADLPDMPRTSVAGHRGRLRLHQFGDQRVLVFQGRIHFYEGHAWEAVERPIRLAHELGVRTLILSNASGGIGPKQDAGTLMAIRGHLAAMRPNWWRGTYLESPYSPELLKLMDELPVGIYASVTGPNYETPAEVRALQACGADAVGMSTAHEANVAASLGMEVAGISCVANRAAGLSATPLSHSEVLAMVKAAAGKMALAIENVLTRRASESR